MNSEKNMGDNYSEERKKAVELNKEDSGNNRQKNMERNADNWTAITENETRRATRSLTQKLSKESRQVPDFKLDAVNDISAKDSRPGSVIDLNDCSLNTLCKSSIIASVRSSRHSHASKSQASSVTSRMSALEISNAIEEV